MKTTVLIACTLALAACGESTPPAPPKPAGAPAPQAEAPRTETKPIAQAPEAPKPDPNKELAARVKQALEGDGKVQVAAIDVTAKEGKVTLWGTAATAAERNRAAQIASKVEGVSGVDNQIKIVKGS